ncbi:sensor histidine kinase [Microbacterium sp. P01]|uniref:sensor histidine kinase n=1 Tax=Microbacterium sp. P01 TaxID=3366261 RepID=UPI00366D7274
MNVARIRRSRALICAVACGLLAAAGMCAIVAAGPDRALASHLIEDTVVALAWAALATLCAVRGRPAAVVLTIAVAWGVSAATNGWALLGVPSSVASAWVSTCAWAIAVGLSYTVGVLHVLPRRSPRAFRGAAVFSVALMTSGFATLPAVTIEDGVAFPNPLALPFSDILAAGGVLATVVTAFAAGAVLAMQATSPSRRRRLIPVVAAAITGMVGLGVGGLANEWAPLVQVLTVPLLPVAIAVSSSPLIPRALRAVSAQLDGAADPLSALAATLTQISRDVGLAGLAIEVDDVVVASVGPVGPEKLLLMHMGRLEGHLRTPRLADDELIEVSSVTASIAAVLCSARLVEEVRRSRAELTVARAEERRKLRRDLHDEVGPLLAAVLTHADVAELALDRSPERTRDSLTKARAAGVDAVVALRRVVRDLGPAAVDDLGLRGALEELAFHLSGGSTAVSATAAAVPAMPAAVEIALYRIAAEAATNALRHASPSVVGIRLCAADGGVLLTVADDGRGFDRSVVDAGVGLASMQNRAAELDGELIISTGATGTTVSARIPVSV